VISALKGLSSGTNGLIVCISIISVDFNVTDQLLLRYSASDTGEKWEYNETVHQLFIDISKAYDSVRSIVQHFH
jgi:hypothetical protein